MNLAKTNIAQIQASRELVVPDLDAFQLPEKVLQFGTGVLLRGLPDLIINNANNKGFFNGRIVVVKSTSNGNSDAFDKQDALYTVCIRGVDEGKTISENHIVSSISRVLSASNEWDKILECASNPDMQLIISNTTEVGITLVKENIHADPPQSFPGKLLSFLYHRFKYFKGDASKGMLVIPTELIPENGDKLLSILLELAHINSLESSFLDWLENANYFCNSLVDRIVPGKMNKDDHERIEKELGYKDELMIMSEVYSLWAIQSDNERVKDILSFAHADSSVVIAPDINKFRELKLRLLNGSHTFSCGLAYLAGFKTVKAAMDDSTFTGYLAKLVFDEIIPTVVGKDIITTEAEDFANKVLDRYRNGFIDHYWLSICMQYSSKMYMRNISMIEKYAADFGQAGNNMSLGMAGFILFMRSNKDVDGEFYGDHEGNRYLITDSNAAFFSDAWKEKDIASTVHRVLSNKDIWGTDLSALKGFERSVLYCLELIMDKGAHYAMKEISKQKKAVLNEK